MNKNYYLYYLKYCYLFYQFQISLKNYYLYDFYHKDTFLNNID